MHSTIREYGKQISQEPCKLSFASECAWLGVFPNKNCTMCGNANTNFWEAMV